MFPRNSATPLEVGIGEVVLKADGTLQTTDVLVRVKPEGGAWGAGAGSLSVDATTGHWSYRPTQGETDATGLQIKIYKANCLGASATIVFSAASTAGQVVTDTASREASKANVSGLSTFNAATDEVTPTAASKTGYDLTAAYDAAKTAAQAGDEMALTGAQVTALVAAIEAEIADDATGEAVKQAIIDKLIENLPDLEDLTLAAISQAVWDRLLTAILTEGSIGKLIKDRVTAARMEKLDRDIAEKSDIPAAAPTPAQVYTEFANRWIGGGDPGWDAASVSAAIAVRANLATELGRIDDSVTSRASSLAIAAAMVEIQKVPRTGTTHTWTNTDTSVAATVAITEAGP
jgi:hypothetical protein